MRVTCPECGKENGTLRPACCLTVVLGGYLFLEDLGAVKRGCLCCHFRAVSTGPFQKSHWKFLGQTGRGRSLHPSPHFTSQSVSACHSSSSLDGWRGGQDGLLFSPQAFLLFVSLPCTEKKLDSGFPLVPGLYFISSHLLEFVRSRFSSEFGKVGGGLP